MTDSTPARVLVLCLLLLPFPLQPVAAQPEEEAAVEDLTPSELYRDVKALLIVDQLQLTSTQIAKIVPIVQKVVDQAAADRAADDAAYAQIAEPSARVIAALVKGEAPAPDDAAALDRAARERTTREDARAALAAQAAAEIQRTMTQEQVSRIETAREQAARKALMARLGGAATPLEYIMQQLEAQTELMADEYARTRQDRALEMAQALLGPNAPGIPALATALLAIMDEVARMTPEQYARARPDLPARIAQTLRLPAPSKAPAIYYDDFLAWITSERTPVALKAALAARPQPEEVQP